MALKLKDRACPDCGSPRIVGYDEGGDDAWNCVSSDCPPTKVALAGTLSFDGDQVPVVGAKWLSDQFAPFNGKRVLITLHVYGEPE